MYGVDLGQKRQVVLVLDEPSEVYSTAQEAFPNNPQQQRQQLKENAKVVTGASFTKLNLTQWWENREGHHLDQVGAIFNNPAGGPPITYYEVLEILKGRKSDYARDFETFRVMQSVTTQLHRE